MNRKRRRTPLGIVGLAAAIKAFFCSSGLLGKKMIAYSIDGTHRSKSNLLLIGLLLDFARQSDVTAFAIPRSF
jgi:hypothetical protein